MNKDIEKQTIEDFDEYIRQGEPDKREKNNLIWMPMPIQDKFRTSSGQVRINCSINSI
ncbi:MAG: hypothetical protein KBS65_03590 [Prevotella sp.]|nr:hypothetical protein [Candidatus Equicola stercoris]